MQVSASTIGEPDLGLLTPPEMATKVNQIASAVPTLTVLADADTGKSQRFGVGCNIELDWWSQHGVVVRALGSSAPAELHSAFIALL